MKPSSETAQLSNQQRLLLAVKQATAKLNEIETASAEAIAIIGTGCRFPGGVDSPESYWKFLRESRDGRVEIPKERWDNDRYYNSEPEAPGQMYVRHGYFLQQPVDQFDPSFFGISGAEAAKIDPSQRLLLEVSWEALENAGISPRSLKNTDTGVYIGQCFNDYALIGMHALPNNLTDFYLGLGTAMNISAGRVAYVLGLQGPTFTLDTTCSSSLVTLHIACQSLRSRESNLALVGGVNLMLHPNVTHGFCKGRALSPDSRCKTFDASADGYARGEGCGVVVLKRLRDAVADGDRILALVRGSAINHDGPSSGLTVPNQQAQKKVIRQALANAKLDPLQVDYVECHGTGTSLGDPLEVKAIDEVYCQERSKEDPLILGAVKSNVGHLEAAAGVAGLMKIILALQNQEIPPNLHFNQPNPQINWEKIPVKVATTVLPWSKASKPLVAGISGFGMSGTNAHVILQEAPVQVKQKAEGESEDDRERSLHLLTLSAKTGRSLQELVVRYQNYLEKESNKNELADICYTANTGRTHLNHRLAVIAANQTELLDKLAAGLNGEGIFSGQVSSSTSPKVAFLFSRGLEGIVAADNRKRRRGHHQVHRAVGHHAAEHGHEEARLAHDLDQLVVRKRHRLGVVRPADHDRHQQRAVGRPTVEGVRRQQGAENARALAAWDEEAEAVRRLAQRVAAESHVNDRESRGGYPVERFRQRRIHLAHDVRVEGLVTVGQQDPWHQLVLAIAARRISHHAFFA